MKYLTKIKDEDLDIKTYVDRKHITTFLTKIRVTHAPTGFIAECDMGNQWRSKAVCIKMLQIALDNV